MLSATDLSSLTGWPMVLAVAMVVLVLFAWQAAGLVSVARGKFIDESALRLKSSGAREAGMGLEQVAALHLFGDVTAVQAVAPPPTDIPKTSLKLVLVGAMTNSDPKKASALIGADNQTRRYFVGDNVAGGAVLHEVRSDSVVLQRDGRYETLLFPRTSDVPAITTVRASPASTVGRPGTVGVIHPVSPGSPDGVKNLSLRERLQPDVSSQPHSEDR